MNIQEIHFPKPRISEVKDVIKVPHVIHGGRASSPSSCRFPSYPNDKTGFRGCFSYDENILLHSRSVSTLRHHFHDFFVKNHDNCLHVKLYESMCSFMDVIQVIMLDYEYCFVCIILELMHGCFYLTILVYIGHIDDDINVYMMN